MTRERVFWTFTTLFFAVCLTVALCTRPAQTETPARQWPTTTVNHPPAELLREGARRLATHPSTEPNW